MERYMEFLIHSAQKRVDQFLKLQVTDPGQPDYGAIKTEMLETKPTIYVLACAAAVYCCKDSRYWHDARLLEAMNLAMDFVGRYQRDNGGLDYPSCNFNSAADTSFCFKRLIGAYRLFELYEPHAAEVESLKAKYKLVMKKALGMICSGGFHTPNHRWGIAAALMQGAGLFAEDQIWSGELLHRADLYLAEGIDGNAEGEYAERSTGNYNAVVNQAMMSMYEESGDVEFLGYVARNLNMMQTYIDPDDTIFTQNSTRQDQGKSDYPDKYFYQYLYMAAAATDPSAPYAGYHQLFDGAAHKIIHDCRERGDLAPDCLHIIMLHKEMEEYHFQNYGYLATYRKYYEDAGVLRVKTPLFGYSVLKGKSAFLYLKAGSMPVFVKIGESIGSCRNFIADTIEVEAGHETKTESECNPVICRLESVVNASYYLPFQEKQSTSDWWKMDHASRDILVNSQLKTNVVITQEEDGLTLEILTEGLSSVPVRVEICVPAGAVLENSQFHQSTGKGEGIILRDGTVTLRQGEQVMEIGPGFGTHEFKGHYSGEEANDSGYTIWMNDYTPFERKIRFRVR